MAISAKPYRLPIPGALRGTAATNTKTRGGVPTKYRVMSYRTRFAGGAIYSRLSPDFVRIAHAT